MNPENLSFFANVLLKQTGLSIGPDKAYLIESRLTPIARRHGLNNHEDVIAAMRKGGNLVMAREALDAMMTHESFFFRDTRPFDEFRQHVLPSLLASKASSRKIRIWCAAASTGQEPYSLAMILKEEAARLAGWTVELVGTDIVPNALNYAREGLYTQFEVQRGLPIQMLVKYFTKEGEAWRVNPPLRSMISYREFNLLSDPMALGVFDVVFCRNVLIYFDQATKAQVLQRIARQMEANSFLFLGGAETVIGITDTFSPLAGRRGIYTPSAAQPAKKAVG